MVTNLLGGWLGARIGLNLTMHLGMLFGVVFAINFSLHSYLILDYSDHDRVAMNVGLYCMANAGGWLTGTVLSGLPETGSMPGLEKYGMREHFDVVREQPVTAQHRAANRCCVENYE